MMINSLFVLSNSGDIFIEKHWKSVIHRSICDYFFEAQSHINSQADISPVIQTPHHYLIHIFRNKVFYLAVCLGEVPPLFVIEFLHRVVDIIEDYFGSSTETVIKDQIVRIYEILDEMLDNGFPLATEANILKELIKPPNLFRSLTDTMTGKQTGVSATLPAGQLSSCPWRRTGVRYANNEVYCDVIEEIDAIVDRSGCTVFAEVQGYIDCTVHLSGMPDLTLSFINPRLIDDVSFHPCVRFKRWDTEKILSFVPPDGRFRLISYNVGCNSTVSIPVHVRHRISFKEMNSFIDISVTPKTTMGKTLEKVSLEIKMPKVVANVSLTTTVGRHSFDPVTKVLSWDVGKVETSKVPNIKGGIILQTGAPVPESDLVIEVNFVLLQMTVSGLKVNRLDMYGENFKPFKGVKYATKAGRFQIRT